MDWESKECEVYMDVCFWSTLGTSYRRELWDFEYDCIGEIVVDEEVLDSIETVSDLIKACEKRALISYCDKNIGDIDEAMEFFTRAYGEGYQPDEKEDWYVLQDGKGLKGEKVVSYLKAYKDNIDEHQGFLASLSKYKDLELEYIEIEVRKWGSKPVTYLKEFEPAQMEITF